VTARRTGAHVALGVSAALVFVAWESRAAEPGCDTERGPWVRFEEDASTSGTLALSEIVGHVRAELERKGIRVCLEGRGEPVATVAYRIDEARTAQVVQVLIDVKDAVTQKRVSRSLDLRGIPTDARPLAVAVGTDELLTASWAEVALSRRGPPKQRAPREIARIVSDELPEPERRADAAAAVVYESYSGGMGFAGVDLRAGYRPFERLGFTARLGVRRGFDEGAPNGTVHTSAWGGGVGLRAALTPLTSGARPFGVDAVARLDAWSASFSPDAKGDAVARPGQAVAVVGTAGVALRFAPVRALRFGVEGTLGVPFHPVRITDSAATVSEISGLALGAAAEVALAF
jgi:hypothetical protein